MLRAASSFAAYLNHTSEATSWATRADGTASSIGGVNFDDSVGAYFDTTEPPDVEDPTYCHLRDDTTWAILGQVSSHTRDLSGLAFLNSTLRRPYGNVFGDCGDTVWPFTGYTEVLARYKAGDDAGALELIRREWAGALSPGSPKTTMEVFGSIGASGLGTVELAAGMSTGAAPALTNYVLGIKPTSPGFGTFDVIPRTGDLAWANGAISTPHGAITVSWTKSTSNYSLTVSSPAGSIGRFGVPSGGVVTLDGKKVWNGTAAVAGSKLSIDGNFVVIGGIGSGTHTVVRTAK